MNIINWTYDTVVNPTVDGFAVYGDSTALAVLPPDAVSYTDSTVRAAPVNYSVVPTVGGVAQVDTALPTRLQTFRSIIPDMSTLYNRAKYVKIQSNGFHPKDWYDSFGKTTTQNWYYVGNTGEPLLGKYWSATLTYDTPTKVSGVSINTAVRTDKTKVTPSVTITLHGDGILLGTLDLTSEDMYSTGSTYNMSVSNPSLYLAYKITVTISDTEMLSTSNSYDSLSCLTGIRFQGEI